MTRNIRTKNKITISKKYATMYLYSAKQEVVGSTVFDKKHVEKVKEHKWYLSKTGYVKSGNGVQQKRLTFHRFILGLNDDDARVVDHINLDPLDNRDCNLRVCERIQNTFNSPKKKNNSSGIIGVSWLSSRNKWVAQIMFKGNGIFLGYSDDFDECVKLRLMAEKEYFGEFSPQLFLFEKYGI